MDLLDVCYESNMKLFRDSPATLVAGRWKRCPPGAIVYPGWHAFGSQTQDPNEFVDVEPMIGEARGKLGQVIGTTTPGYSGQHFCGDANAWEFGNLLSQQGSLPIDSRGRPVCCGAVDQGEIRIDGTSFLAPVHQLFLRTDPGPPPVNIPSDNSPNWAFHGHAPIPRLLSGIAGSTPDHLNVNQIVGVDNGDVFVGPFVNFYSGSLSTQELPAQNLTLSIGFTISLTTRLSVALAVEAWLMDGVTGDYKQALIPLSQIGPQDGVKPHRGRFLSAVTDPISIAAGDFFQVGYGLHLVDTASGGHHYIVAWEWEGTDTVFTDNQVVTTTRAVLTLEDA